MHCAHAGHTVGRSHRGRHTRGHRSCAQFPDFGLVEKTRFSEENWRKYRLSEENLGISRKSGHREDSILEKSIICLIRVRGFPLRDILSLRALGGGLGQGARIVGASPPPPSASIFWVLGLIRKSCKNHVLVKKSGSIHDLVKENSLIYMNIWFLYSFGFLFIWKL